MVGALFACYNQAAGAARGECTMWFSRKGYPGFFVLGVILSGCFGHRETLPDFPVGENNERLVVRRQPQVSKTAESTKPVGQKELLKVMPLKRPEKSVLWLENGQIGYMVTLFDDQRVFLADDSYMFGSYNFDQKKLSLDSRIDELFDYMAGSWRLANHGDRALLEAACTAFIRGEEMPYVCEFGTWTQPDEESAFVQVIYSGGMVENQECSSEAGLMLVEQSGEHRDNLQ